MTGDRLAYPATARGSDADVLHGVRVEDPYRWLEREREPEVLEWVASQNALADAVLGGIDDVAWMRARLAEIDAYERWTIPVRRGGRYFVFRRRPDEQQPVLCVMRALDEEARALLDPNAWSPDGTIAITGFAPSPDGELVAYAVSTGGSNWMEWRVVETGTGRHRDDVLRWSKFSAAAWYGAGFFYSRYDDPGDDPSAPDRNHKLCFHRLGDDQSLDRVVFEQPEHPERTFFGVVTEDERYLLVFVTQGHDGRCSIYARDLHADGSSFAPLVEGFDGRYSFAGNDGSRMFFVTDVDAPRRRLVEIDVRDPARDRWRTILPERKATLEWCVLKGDGFYAGYLEHVRTRVRRVSLDGTDRGEVALPVDGWAAGFGGAPDDGEALFAATSFAHPLSIHRLDVATGGIEPIAEPKASDIEDLIVEQVFVDRDDGARIPMTTIRKRGVELDGDRQTLLYGYGGFGISLLPWFSAPAVAWAERGGIYAVANIRGGGEYGETWHEQGSRANKINCFEDFVACARWLCDNGVTRPERLAISGGSNGGLLVGACITRHPDLFAAAHASVGIFDLVRFPRFTIGWAWIAEYGSPDDPDDFERLLSLSPLHNVRAGTRYPALLLTTGDHDDHVVPAHSYKFAAAMQAAQASSEPVLLRVYENVGHGIGKPAAAVIEEGAESLGFLWSRVAR